MGKTVPFNQVKAYLLRIKQAVAAGRYQFIPRRKNVLSLAAVGLLPKHVKDYILRLTPQDYFNGPEDEIDQEFPPGEYVCFGCDIYGKEFYVKVKLEQNNGENYCVCISFHIADSPIYYPYKRDMSDE